MNVVVRCRCGALRGVAAEVSPANVNRALCYCRDCRAYLHWLEREDLVDAQGGTEIIQLARNRLRIDEGISHVRSLRLSSRGLHRWYADCCNTPIGNTMPSIPFIGLARAALDVVEEGDATFGPPLYTSLETAIGGRPPGARISARGLAHVTGLLASWAWNGLGHPTPLFDRENRPTIEPRVLADDERQTLREHSRA